MDGLFSTHVTKASCVASLDAEVFAVSARVGGLEDPIVSHVDEGGLTLLRLIVIAVTVTALFVVVRRQAMVEVLTMSLGDEEEEKEEEEEELRGVEVVRVGFSHDDCGM